MGSVPDREPIVAGTRFLSHQTLVVGSDSFLRFPCKRGRGMTLARQRVKEDRLPARTSRAAQREAISAQVLFGGSARPCAA